MLHGLVLSAADMESPAVLPPEPTRSVSRVVGIGYEPWFGTAPFDWQPNRTWDEPLLGHYDSADPQIIRQHAEWLADAGVDFVLVDWSNNIGYLPKYRPSREIGASAVFHHIEAATDKLFEVYAGLPSKPRIAILLGITDSAQISNGNLTYKANEVYDLYLANPKYRPLYFQWYGKPLLVIYTGTPSFCQGPPPAWQDPRFTVRWMTGFASNQKALIDDRGSSKHGYWSWEEREPRSYTIVNGEVEAVTISAGYRGLSGWTDSQTAKGRRDGKTFQEAWEYVHTLRPRLVFINSWNDWVPGEEHSLELSNDIEPSKALGNRYLRLLKKETARFKALP